MLFLEVTCRLRHLLLVPLLKSLLLSCQPLPSTPPLLLQLLRRSDPLFLRLLTVRLSQGENLVCPFLELALVLGFQLLLPPPHPPRRLLLSLLLELLLLRPESLLLLGYLPLQLCDRAFAFPSDLLCLLLMLLLQPTQGLFPAPLQLLLQLLQRLLRIFAARRQQLLLQLLHPLLELLLKPLLCLRCLPLRLLLQLLDLMLQLLPPPLQLGNLGCRLL
mmetsp:Transcript_2437/g.5810  ORF Transcript_2437/g.5810 Transcript_2437/m.5810 type:complete len:218 (+) Transcript_2437:904-1557(+)